MDKVNHGNIYICLRLLDTRRSRESLHLTGAIIERNNVLNAYHELYEVNKKIRPKLR